MNLRSLVCVLSLCLFPVAAQNLSPPTATKSFGAASVLLGGTTSISILVANPNTAPLTGVGITDVLPPGLFVEPPYGDFAFCGGTYTITPTSLTFTGFTLGAGSSCGVTTSVRGVAVGVQTNTTGAPTSAEAGAGAPATATLTVIGPPAISKTFGGFVAIPVGASATLSFTISNPNPTVALAGVGFTDTLPPGLLIGPIQPGAACNGTPVTAVPGTNLISLAGAVLPPAGQCTFHVNVTAIQAGLQTNVTSNVTSANGGDGNQATAQVRVGDTLQVNYAANLSVGDSVFNLTNTGETGGNICANVYVFSPDEQLVSCCSCRITPNGLVSLSAKNDLISNTLTPAVPGSIVVKLVATGGPSCNPAVLNPGVLSSGLTAWGTTLHAAPGAAGAYALTENPFRPSTLSVVEMGRIAALCGFIQGNGSGYGICRSCRSGGLGAERQ
jgi:uncharacterized repeat protein (TIGR01451 family)